MLEFVVLFGREIEQFLCKVLRIVDDINWHKILTTWLDLSLLQLLQSFLLLFLQFLFLFVSVLCNSLHSFNILRVNRFLIITVILYFLNRFSSRDQKVGSNHSNFRRLTETSFNNMAQVTREQQAELDSALFKKLEELTMKIPADPSLYKEDVLKYSTMYQEEF